MATRFVSSVTDGNIMVVIKHRRPNLRTNMAQENLQQTKSIQNRLWIALAVTLALSIALRLMAPGWTLFHFGIVLILIALVHLIIHIRAMKRVPIAARRYVYLIAFSHLLFFLGFVF